MKPHPEPALTRSLTSHEKMAGRPWDDSYKAGPAPWDIGRPQSAVLQLAASGAFVTPVLDAGCGTGENALHLASLGLEVVGVDVADTALAMATRKAADQGSTATFMGADAFQLHRLGRSFQSVLDSGLFHAFNSDERSRYAKSLASVVAEGGRLHLFCFSDQGEDQGPHPVSQSDLHAAFNSHSGWSIESIAPVRIETRFHDHGAPGWRATIRRTAE